MSTEEILLLWVNSTLEKLKSRSNALSSEIKCDINNFSNDFMDGKTLVLLFHALWPNQFSLESITVSVFSPSPSLSFSTPLIYFKLYIGLASFSIGTNLYICERNEV